MMFKKLIRILFLLPLVFLSCEREMNLNNITDELADSLSIILPLGSFDANVGSAIMNYMKYNPKVVIDGDKVFYVISDSSVIDFHSLDLLRNARSVSETFIPQLILIPANKTNSTEFQQYLDLGLNLNEKYERLDSINIKRAVISFSLVHISGISPENIEFKIELDKSQVKDVSKPIIFKPQVIGETIDLELNNIRFFSNGNKPLPISVTITLKAGSQQLVITPETKISYTYKFQELDYSVAYGFFAPSILAKQILQRKLNLDGFLNSSLLRFTNPKFDVTGTSNVGAFIKFSFDSLKVFYDDRSSITADFDGKKWMDYRFNAKPVSPGEIIHFKMRTIDSLWGGTSRFFDKLEKPDSLEYSYGTAIDNERSINDPTPDFLVPNTEVKVKVTATLPFNLNSGSFYLYEDSVTTISESLSEQIKKIDFKDIDTVFLVLKIQNGLSFGCSIELSFYDSTYSQIKSDIKTLYQINPGSVDNYGVVLPENISPQNLRIALSKQQFEDLKKTKSLHIKIRIAGNIDSKMNISAHDKIKIAIAVFLKNKAVKN